MRIYQNFINKFSIILFVGERMKSEQTELIIGLRRIQLMISVGYVLSALFVFAGLAITYYFNVPPSTASGWNIGNHPFWWAFMIAVGVAIFIFIIGIVGIIKRPYFGEKETVEQKFLSAVKKLSLQCKKCGGVFEILSTEKDREHKCPKCGETGIIAT